MSAWKGQPGQPLGIYIHLPFCQHKCAYCDFPSYAGQEARREEYTQAVAAEIRSRARETGPLPVDTVFLGGGTPSLMEPEQVAALLGTLRDCHRLLPDAEITCEANPGSISPAFLQMLVEQGVNRLSLGAQSAHAAELRLLERVHSWDQVAASVAQARAAGIANINLDLMTALPGQDWDTLKHSLDLALDLAPSHLSCYSLILEPGTPFYKRHARGELALPPDDLERELYWNTVAYLTARGYEHYEISNFALPGRRCRHNENTWRYRDYLGFGASAAGLYKGQRRKNPDDLFDYLQGQVPRLDQISPAEACFEQVMLALRLREGLDLGAFAARHGRSPHQVWPRALKRHLAGGLLVEAGGCLRLTDVGFDLMDRVLVDLLAEES